MQKLKGRDIIFEKGIFVKQFSIEDNYLAIFKACISDYKDLIDVSNNFKCEFYNSGIMVNGGIYTVKTKSDYNLIYPLRKIREEKEIDEKYFLSEQQIEKIYLFEKKKRIPRTKPDGTPYYYSEGAMSFPDNLDAPARTILTSEGGVSRTTHAIEDFKTKKLRLLTPIECERINVSPDNWTNTGITEKKRNFMIGNALVVGVIEKIGEEIEEIIENED